MPGGAGGGLGKGSNLNAYNVLYDAQHGLNQDGTPINYGGLETTDTLASSINAQIPLEGLETLDNLPALPVNPITGPDATTDTAALQINPLIPEESSSSSAADAFNTWWSNFTGNPLNQPDTLPDQSIDSGDASSDAAAPDYPGYSGDGFTDTVNDGGDNLGSYGGDSGGDSYDGTDGSSYAYAGSSDSGSSYDSGGGDTSGGDTSGDSGDPYGGGFDNFG